MKTVLITGASSGIGRSLALKFASQDYQLILMARRLDLLQHLKEQIIKNNPTSSVILCASDVSDFEKHMQDVKESVQHAGGLDLVIANAGIGLTSIETENCFSQIRKTVDINIIGACATIEAAKDVFLKQGYGHIVGVTSVAGARGMPTSAIYCASKSALTSFLEGLRIDLSTTKISVTAIHPGFVETPLTEKNGKMPFLVSADRSAELIFRAINRKKARYVFPWQMSIVYKLLILMPDCLYDGIMKLFNKKAIQFKQHRD